MSHEHAEPAQLHPRILPPMEHPPNHGADAPMTHGAEHGADHATPTAATAHARGVLAWRETTIGLLDADRLFDSIARSLR